LFGGGARRHSARASAETLDAAIESGTLPKVSGGWKRSFEEEDRLRRNGAPIRTRSLPESFVKIFGNIPNIESRHRVP
jgi:hypothetical protein